MRKLMRKCGLGYRGLPSNELDMKEVKRMRKLGIGFEGVSKEQYASYNPRQRYMLASLNHNTLEELDKKFGVETDIGKTEEEQEEFVKKYHEHQSQVADIVLNAMESEGCFKRVDE